MIIYLSTNIWRKNSLSSIVDTVLFVKWWVKHYLHFLNTAALMRRTTTACLYPLPSLWNLAECRQTVPSKSTCETYIHIDIHKWTFPTLSTHTYPHTRHDLFTWHQFPDKQQNNQLYPICLLGNKTVKVEPIPFSMHVFRWVGIESGSSLLKHRRTP